MFCTNQAHTSDCRRFQSRPEAPTCRRLVDLQGNDYWVLGNTLFRYEEQNPRGLIDTPQEEPFPELDPDLQGIAFLWAHEEPSPSELPVETPLCGRVPR